MACTRGKKCHHCNGKGKDENKKTCYWCDGTGKIADHNMVRTKWGGEKCTHCGYEISNDGVEFGGHGRYK